jgi:hypothetical protein
VLAAVALGGVGEAGRQPAGAAPGETPARKITRLRAKAARVQAAIDRMNTRVEGLVEDYNEVREALARTRAEQARTRRQVLDARRRLRAARRQLGKRLWTIYTGGAPSTLGQLLAADSVHQALVTTKYQEQVVGADRAAVDRVERLRREVEALAAKLADQAERQERLQARLAAKRRQIEARLAAQRRYLKRLTRQVRRAVAEERRRRNSCAAGPCSAAWPPNGPHGRPPPNGQAQPGRTRPGRPEPLRGGRAGGRLRQEPAGQAVPVGADGPSTYDRGRRCGHIEVEKIVAAGCPARAGAAARLAAAGRPRPLAASASDAELAAAAGAHEAQAAQLRDGALVDAMRRAYLTLEPIRIKAGPGWCCWPNCSPQRRRSWPPRSPPSCARSAWIGAAVAAALATVTPLPRAVSLLP